MTTATPPTDLVTPTPAWPWRILRLAAGAIVPAVASLLVLRFAFPSRLGGAGGGVAGFFSWLVDSYPLFVGLGLFLAFSEAGRYWTRRWSSRTAVARPAARPLSLRSMRRLGLGLGVVIVIAFVTRTSLVATFKIAGPSMLPTLEIGDRVLVNRLAYGVALPFSKVRLRQKLPHRGDLVVFQARGMAGANGAQSFVKRVIGLPGDRISVEQGSLAINGSPIAECDAGPFAELSGWLTVRGRLTVEFLDDKTYLTVRKPIETAMPPYTVKPGEVFVVGDDRGMSSDSRAWNEGHGAGVPVDILEGRVSRVLVGARADGRLDFSRLLAPLLNLKVRMSGVDMRKTDERIQKCLAQRPAVTSAPPLPTDPPPMSY